MRLIGTRYKLVFAEIPCARVFAFAPSTVFADLSGVTL